MSLKRHVTSPKRQARFRSPNILLPQVAITNYMKAGIYVTKDLVWGFSLGILATAHIVPTLQYWNPIYNEISERVKVYAEDKSHPLWAEKSFRSLSLITIMQLEYMGDTFRNLFLEELKAVCRRSLFNPSVDVSIKKKLFSSIRDYEVGVLPPRCYTFDAVIDV
jgi:hypothetical protein